jgi:L-aspartate oxidase
MGGILTDTQGRSTVDGLWACGEVASTGAHGANRLASNSLLEAVVFGARVAHDIASFALPTDVMLTGPRETDAPTTGTPSGESRAEQRLRETMAAEVGVIRDDKSLRGALTAIGALEQENEGDRRLTNMLTTATLIAAAALQRKESRGAHFRSDYPMQVERLASRRFLTLAQAVDIAREAREAPEPTRRLHAASDRAALHA